MSIGQSSITNLDRVSLAQTGIFVGEKKGQPVRENWTAAPGNFTGKCNFRRSFFAVKQPLFAGGIHQTIGVADIKQFQ
jgi:hypothetical protein